VRFEEAILFAYWLLYIATSIIFGIVDLVRCMDLTAIPKIRFLVECR